MKSNLKRPHHRTSDLFLLRFWGQQVTESGKMEATQNVHFENDHDSDENGDVLKVSAVTDGNSGTVTTDGISVTCTPGADFNGEDSFTKTVDDGNGGTDTATVDIMVDASND